MLYQSIVVMQEQKRKPILSIYCSFYVHTLMGYDWKKEIYSLASQTVLH